MKMKSRAHSLQLAAGSFNTGFIGFLQKAYRSKKAADTGKITTDIKFLPPLGKRPLLSLFIVLALAVMAMVFGVAGSAQAAGEFSIIDLGVQIGGRAANPVYINMYGQMTGQTSMGGVARAFLISPVDGQWYRDEDGNGVNDLMINLGSLGGGHSYGHGINDLAQVVGSTDSDVHYNLAFVWEDGTMRELGIDDKTDYVERAHLAIPAWEDLWLSANSSALDINNSGQVVGRFTVPNIPIEPDCHPFDEDKRDVSRAFLDGTDLGVIFPPSDCYSGSSAKAINNSGQVVGRATVEMDEWPFTENHAFLWSGGAITDLGTFSPTDINDSGQIVGATGGHPILWLPAPAFGLPAGMNDLGTFPWYNSSTAVGRAFGINNFGQVVGKTANNSSSFSSAFLWLPEAFDFDKDGTIDLEAGMHDLNMLKESCWPNNCNLIEAYSINDGGQIAGAGTISSDIINAFLLTPAGYVPPVPPVPIISAANYDYSGEDADPVNTYTGEYFFSSKPDLYLGGPMPLYLGRYYASGLKQSGVTGSLGDNWLHNFEWSLAVSGTDATITSHKGRKITFSDNGASWDLTGTTNIPFQFVESGSNYVLYNPGIGLLYTFDSAGALIKIEDGKGNSHTLTYSGSDLSTVSDGLGRTLTFTYSGGKLSTVSDGTRTVDFAHTGNDLTHVTDALGNITTYAYDSGGLMTSWTLPAGNTPFSQTWNGSGQVDSQTDSDGNTMTFAYAAPDTTITDALGDIRVHSHTATGELNGSTDRVNNSVAIGSDADGRRNLITDRLGDTTSFVYHAASGKLSSKTNADGTGSSFSYTARGSVGVTQYDLTGITHADSTTESFVYDAGGNPTSSTDRAGKTSSATYNSNGQPLTTTNTEDGVTTYSYNADATPATRVDPAGNTTTFGYDALRRLNQLTFADTSARQFTYDEEDRLLSSIDENASTTAFSYDANGNLETITDPLDNTTTFAYDGNDRLLSTTDQLGGIFSVTYDALGRPETTTDENSNTTTSGYDTLGRLTTVTHPNGSSNSFTYDAEAVIASAGDGLGNTATFTTDQMGRVTQTSSPLGNISQIGYDAMGSIISNTDPLTQTTTFNRDSRGLLSGIDLPGGVISAAYTRNSLGNITQITDPNGSNWQSSFNNQGLRISRTDPLLNVHTVVYDNRNRPSAITYADGVIQTLGYDLTGNLASRSYSDGGPVFNYSYDANSRLTSADGIALAYDANNRITDSNGITLSRDAGGRITSMTLAAGKTVTYAYDANDNLISVTDWADAATSFSYDAADRLTSITRPTANVVDTSYTYDNDGRLTGITEGAISSISLTRDANGQIIAATRDVPLPASSAAMTSSANTYDAASQNATAGFVYDARGRLTDDGTKTYTWDAASRLSSVKEGAATTTYTYDALGQRLSRGSGGVDRSFVWNIALGFSSISIERDGAGDDLRYFIHTPAGALLYSIDAVSNARQFYHFDEMSNAIAVTDDSGAVIGSYAYTPYGKLSASTGALDNPFTWQGQYGVMDEGNGLYYMRARYYDSVTGRFISRDPVESINPKGVNPYQYAFGNPVKFVDPTGLTPCSYCFNPPKWTVADIVSQNLSTAHLPDQEALQELRSVYRSAIDSERLMAGMGVLAQSQCTMTADVVYGNIKTLNLKHWTVSKWRWPGWRWAGGLYSSPGAHSAVVLKRKGDTWENGITIDMWWLNRSTSFGVAPKSDSPGGTPYSGEAPGTWW